MFIFLMLHIYYFYKTKNDKYSGNNDFDPGAGSRVSDA